MSEAEPRVAPAWRKFPLAHDVLANIADERSAVRLEHPKRHARIDAAAIGIAIDVRQPIVCLADTVSSPGWQIRPASR